MQRNAVATADDDVARRRLCVCKTVVERLGSCLTSSVTKAACQCNKGDTNSTAQKNVLVHRAEDGLAVAKNQEKQRPTLPSLVKPEIMRFSHVTSQAFEYMLPALKLYHLRILAQLGVRACSGLIEPQNGNE